MLVTLTPSMSRITKVRSLVPPCFDTSAPRNTPGPCRFPSTKVPGGAGALSPCVRRGLQTPGAQVAASACGRGGAFLRFAMWTSSSWHVGSRGNVRPHRAPGGDGLSSRAPRGRSATVQTLITRRAHMLAELQERDATGEIAVIYEEIRRFWAVPYVSSLQRHLATRPGWLEWTWDALRPVFASGIAQLSAWRAAANLQIPTLSPISHDALRVWGVSAEAEALVRATCESFVRVSPVNLVLSALLRRLLRGERPTGPPQTRSHWTPPAPLGPLPTLVDVSARPLSEGKVLAALGTTVGGSHSCRDSTGCSPRGRASSPTWRRSSPLAYTIRRRAQRADACSRPST